MNEFLTIKEVAKILKVSEPTIHRWIREKKINANKVGRLIRIPEEELKKLIKQ